MKKPTRPMMKALRTIFVALALALSAQPASAVDPLYQSEMQKLLGIIGSLYFLQPLCGDEENDWRLHAGELISLDNPDEDRRQRLNGAFNQGYYAYARSYNSCTISAQRSVRQLLEEAEQITRDIHSRYADQN
ncbi:MAG: TIGR02301 family protein [Devosiaceae bacterium]|nr:TIGR02301 family protein [Devosiaceae bacterium]